jgi:ABC-2 type transport system ATP-binding protein
MILEVKNINKSYSNLKALDSVSFSIDEGQYVAIIGPNGSGKSTLMQILTGLFLPDSGEVNIFNLGLKKNLTFILSKIGIVFQQPTMDGELYIYANLKFHSQLHGMSHSLANSRIKELVEKFELKEHLNKQAKNLSGGLKRRLEIVRSILHNPKILILDEATSGLDPESRKNILTYITDLNKNEKLTIISITHLKDETLDVDKVIMLKNGKLVFNDTKDNFLENN